MPEHYCCRAGQLRLSKSEITYITSQARDKIPQLVHRLPDLLAPTVADSPNGAKLCLTINLIKTQNKVSFDASLRAARDNGINLSSQLLNLARYVTQ